MGIDITMVPANEEYAKEFSGWRYPDEYSIYNMPPWDEMIKMNFSLTTEEKRNKEYKAFISESSSLLALCRFVEKNHEITVGIGVNPEYLSIGIGKTVIKKFTDWLIYNFPHKNICLEVRTWNERAVNCYKKSGYVITEKFNKKTSLGIGEFYKMYYQNN
ncbi:GNAT family N-acetyltransferase [Anaeropeptidivorans aminofermentans]|uniref:GNAT family N-acetyltransferase n=1 Tax=Anaeropeptidivorans aminofermentans TaxID=2934315 RepID=UPI002024ABF6|nr:GNAT family N-acetyltransferase [Anaeropeptidivorans aminofermentans]